jgi:hypothetical protein
MLFYIVTTKVETTLKENWEKWNLFHFCSQKGRDTWLKLIIEEEIK